MPRTAQRLESDYNATMRAMSHLQSLGRGVEASQEWEDYHEDFRYGLSYALNQLKRRIREGTDDA